MKAGTSAEEVEELQHRLELLREELQELQHGPILTLKPAPRALGLAPAAGKVYRVGPGVFFGGYGELLYQKFANRWEDGGAAGKVDTADGLRYVLTTWRELEVGLYGDLDPLSYRSYLLTGLDARKLSAQGLRSGRQSGSKAKAETLVGWEELTGPPPLAFWRA
ncbi:MAG: hypothetical protein ACUVRY_01705 [Thermoanaerobaculaceae bacterium]